jgi:hypothetical protein
VSRYFDRKGEPLDLMRFAVLFEDDDYRRVGFDEVGPFEVSTVWLGLNHRHGPGTPLIFETMVFRKGSRADLDGDRYATEREAKEGHKRFVERLRGKQS